MTESDVNTPVPKREIEMDKILATHSPRDLLIVGLVYAFGGGGVNAIIGVRFMMGETRQETAAGIMFFVVAGLLVVAGTWCLIKRARLLKAQRS